ncbi:DUF2894 domain-containing protein [Sorangium sp. So ce1335]|uniref:DUF2894 domain-containing protein n=1 Tax=Sorangium sp. So ce1335 TaxID=3133335 RepID=UPI003F61C19A
MPSTSDFSPVTVEPEERQRRSSQPRSGRSSQPRSGRRPQPGSAEADPQPGSATPAPQPGSASAAPQPGSLASGSATPAPAPQPGSVAAAVQTRSGRRPQPGSVAMAPQPGSATPPQPGSDPQPGSATPPQPGSVAMAPQPGSATPPQPGSDPQPGSATAGAAPQPGSVAMAPQPGSATPGAAAPAPQPRSATAAAQPRSGRPSRPETALAEPRPGSSTTPHPDSSPAVNPASPGAPRPTPPPDAHPGSSTTPHPLAARLAALRSAGADRFDPAAYRFIEALLERAAPLDGGARDRLAARAADRLAALEASFHHAHAEAERQLRALADAGIPDDGALAAALARGDFPTVVRAARRRLRALAEGRQKTAVPALARLRGEAAARDVRLPAPLVRDLAQLPCDGDVVERRVKRQAQALSNALSTALFHESLVSARATLAVARAADNVPEDAGPYNAQVLAARALCAAERLSEPYLRALVASLQDLGALAAALEPPPEKPARKKAAPRSTRDARNTGDAGARRRPARKKESLFRGSR